ncbi:unnamed protein product [Hapterophycus canaliculatus]
MSQRALIENGFVFIACPPLFKIKQGKMEKYVYTQVSTRRVAITQSTGKGDETVN